MRNLTRRKWGLTLPLALLSGCVSSSLVDLPPESDVVSLKPPTAAAVSVHRVGELDQEEASLLAAIDTFTGDPEADRLIQLTRMRRRASMQAVLKELENTGKSSGGVTSDGWDQIYLDRRAARSNKARQRAEARINRPNKAVQAQMDRIERITAEEAMRVEVAAREEARLMEQRLKAEAELAERLARAQTELAERLAAAQEERDARIALAEAERDLKLAYLGIELDKDQMTSLQDRLKAIEARAAKPRSKADEPPPSTFAKITQFFRGKPEPEPSVEELLVRKEMLLAEKKSLAELAAKFAPENSALLAEVRESKQAEPQESSAPESKKPVPTVAETLVADARSTEEITPVSQPPAAQPTEMLHPSLLDRDTSRNILASAETIQSTPDGADVGPTRDPIELPLAKAPGEMVGGTDNAQPDMAAPREFPQLDLLDSQGESLLAEALSVRTDIPLEPASTAARTDAAPESDVVWDLGAGPAMELADNTRLQPTGSDESTDLGLLTEADMELEARAFPDDVALADTEEPRLLEDLSTDLLSSTTSTPGIVTEPGDLLPINVTEPPAQPAGPIYHHSEEAVSIRQVMRQPELLLKTTGDNEEGTIRDACGPLSPELESLVYQLDIPEAGVRKAVLADLARMGRAAAPALPAVRILLDDTPMVAAHAAWTIWEIDHDDQAVIREFTRLMDSGDEQVVQFAAYSLGSMGPSAIDAVPALRVQRERYAGITRLHVAEAITRIDAFDQASVEVLIQALDAPDQRERWLAALALGQVRHRHAELVVPELTRSLRDENVEVRSASALALGGFGAAAASAVPELQQRADYDAPGVREAARTALACIQR